MQLVGPGPGLRPGLPDHTARGTRLPVGDGMDSSAEGEGWQKKKKWGTGNLVQGQCCYRVISHKSSEVATLGLLHKMRNLGPKRKLVTPWDWLGSPSSLAWPVSKFMKVRMSHLCSTERFCETGTFLGTKHGSLPQRVSCLTQAV